MAKPQPLRVRAYAQMQKLIDAKVTEQGGNNVGVMVDKIIRANGGTPGEPWCGDTVAYCYLLAGSKSVVRQWASVPALERLLTRIKLIQNVARGHVVIYEFTGDNVPDHTALFDRWATPAEVQRAGLVWAGPKSFFWGGEGNTGNTGAQSDSRTGGDGVKLKLRSRSLVAGFYGVRG